MTAADAAVEARVRPPGWEQVRDLVYMGQEACGWIASAMGGTASGFAEQVERLREEQPALTLVRLADALAPFTAAAMQELADEELRPGRKQLEGRHLLVEEMYRSSIRDYHATLARVVACVADRGSDALEAALADADELLRGDG